MIKMVHIGGKQSSSIESIDIERPKIDCLSFVMCPLPAQLIIGFFSFLFFAAAVYSTNEANKAGLKQSILLDVYGGKQSSSIESKT
jgi:hypothetical protein